MLNIFYVQSSVLSNQEYLLQEDCYSLLGVQDSGDITDHMNLPHPTR